MKKIAFALCLLIASNVTAAEWIHIGHNADGEATFVDGRSVVKKGSIVTVNVLVNHGSESNYGSSRMATSFDCKERRLQILSIETYKQTDAKGGLIESINPGLGWGVIRPKTIGEKQWKFACAPKSASETQAAVQYPPSDPRAIFKAGALLESDQLLKLMDKHFPGAKYRPNNTMVVIYQNQTFVISVQKQNDSGIPAIYKIISVQLQ